MVRPTFTDSNPELKYYPFSITLDKCNGSFNVLSPKIWVPKETKDINVKAFNMIANKNEAKTIAKHTYVLLDANSIVPYVIQIKNGIMKREGACKNYCKCKKDYSWNPRTCICENKVLLILQWSSGMKLYVMDLHQQKWW